MTEFHAESVQREKKVLGRRQASLPVSSTLMALLNFLSWTTEHTPMGPLSDGLFPACGLYH